MKPKTKFTLLVLVWAIGLLIPFLTVFNRTAASQFVGAAVGFGIGWLIYPPTGLPFLVYAWLTRRWNVFRASIVAMVLYLPVLFYFWRGLSYVGEDIEYLREILGLTYSTTVGVALLQLLFTFLSFAFNTMRRS